MTPWSQMFLISVYQKASGNWDSILKSKDITLLTKVHIVKAMVFLVVMYGCESQIIKKAEWWRIDAFKLWCWRRLESSLDCKIKPVNLKVKVKLLSRVRLSATPWTVAYQAPPSMGFSRQEHWSGLPFPSPGDLHNPGIKPGSSALQADSLLLSHQERPQCRTRFNSWVEKIPWRREWQPTPIFLPGEFQGQRSLVGYSPWSYNESDTTEGLTLSLFTFQEIQLKSS